MRLQLDLTTARPFGRAHKQSVHARAVTGPNQIRQRRTDDVLDFESYQFRKTLITVQDEAVAAQNGGAFVHPLYKNPVDVVSAFNREHLLATWAVVFFPASLLGTTLMMLLPRWVSLSENGRMAAALLPTLIFAVVVSRHARLLFLIIDHHFDPIDEDDRKHYRTATAA